MHTLHIDLACSLGNTKHVNFHALRYKESMPPLFPRAQGMTVGDNMMMKTYGFHTFPRWRPSGKTAGNRQLKTIF